MRFGICTGLYSVGSLPTRHAHGFLDGSLLICYTILQTDRGSALFVHIAFWVGGSIRHSLSDLSFSLLLHCHILVIRSPGW